MRISQQRDGFTLLRHGAGTICYLASVASVASIASAIGVVLAVLVLTTPTRSALVFAPLPAVAWVER